MTTETDLTKLLETYQKLCLAQHKTSSIGLRHTIKSDKDIVKTEADAIVIQAADERLRVQMKKIVLMIAARTNDEFCVNCGAPVEYAGIEFIEDYDYDYEIDEIIGVSYRERPSFKHKGESLNTCKDGDTGPCPMVHYYTGKYQPTTLKEMAELGRHLANESSIDEPMEQLPEASQ